MSDLSSLEEEELPIFFTVGGKDGASGVDLFLASDEMTLWGTFHPPASSESRLLTFTDLVDALTGLEINSGLDERRVQEAVFQCNASRKTLTKVVIARGKSSKGTRPAFLKLEALLYEHHFPEERTPTVDFKDYSPFVIVKKGELLARAFPAREGVPGRTVTGKEIPPGRKEVKILKPGPHTLFAHGKVFAACAGRFVLEGDVFDVSDTLEIKGGIDYSTGHIVFPGNITVGGVVQDGFKLVSGGSITIRDTLDASEVLCKKDLTCGGGVIGKKPGLVRVGGKIEALFLENVQVEVLGNVFVQKAILHSRLFSNGEIRVGEGGKIVSSLVMARKSVHVTQLGNEHGACHIVVGTDFAVHRRLEQVRDLYKEDEERLFKLTNRLENAGASRAEDFEKEIRDRLEAFVEEINQLSAHLFNPETFELVVTGDLFPGVVVEMGYSQFPITSKTKGKIFRLSEDKKSIQVEKIAH